MFIIVSSNRSSFLARLLATRIALKITLLLSKNALTDKKGSNLVSNISRAFIRLSR